MGRSEVDEMTSVLKVQPTSRRSFGNGASERSQGIVYRPSRVTGLVGRSLSLDVQC